MTTISMGEARLRLTETVERAKTEPVLLEDAGRAIAVVLSIEQYRALTEAPDPARLASEESAYQKIFGPFERNEFYEMNDADWQAIFDGKRSSTPDPESWALPAKSRRG